MPRETSMVRTGLVMVELPGRFQVLPGRPSVVLDVAHNPHAAATLAQNLDNMGFHAYTYAVFGAMHDKDIDGVIGQLKDRIDHWCVTDLPLPRAATALQLKEKLLAAGQGPQNVADKEKSIEIFATPALPAPQISSIIATNGTVSLTWPSYAGKTYRVQYKNDLSASNWTSLTPDIMAVSSTASKSDVPGISQRFYRLVRLD